MQDSLPGVLYLQMDNTCRDNKNKYTLTFAALLVQLGVFRKVIVHVESVLTVSYFGYICCCR